MTCVIVRRGPPFQIVLLRVYLFCHNHVLSENMLLFLGRDFACVVRSCFLASFFLPIIVTAHIARCLCSCFFSAIPVRSLFCILLLYLLFTCLSSLLQPYTPSRAEVKSFQHALSLMEANIKHMCLEFGMRSFCYFLFVRKCLFGFVT